MSVPLQPGKDVPNGERPTKGLLVAAAALKPAAASKGPKPQLRPRQDVEQPPAAKLRGRNLLGSVLSHLGSARRRLQMDEKAPVKVIKTVTKPKLRVKQSAKSREKEEKDNLEARLSEHYSHMMNFIRTRVEPILFYLPAKHNAETQNCLEETQRTIRRKIEMLPTHLGGETDADDPEKEAED